MSEESKKYVICGHYGATNIGDEAIGLGLIQAIKETNANHEVTVLSYDKVRSKEFYDNYASEYDVKTSYLIPLGIRSFLRGIFKGELKRTKRTIKDCDRFVLGGGGLFTDERLYAVFLWGWQAYYAVKYKKPLYLIGHSVGPLNSRIGKWIVKKIFNKAEFISVRDSESKKLLLKLGVRKEIHVLCDLAMMINLDGKNDPKNANKKSEQNRASRYFILTFRGWDEKLEKLNKKIVRQIHRIVEKYKLNPVLIPFQLIKENDQENMNKKIVQKDVLRKIVIQKYQDDFFEILRQIQGAEFVIGVRLHSLIFSAMKKTPFVGISYSKKVENFMYEIGLEKYCLKNDQFDDDFLEDLIENMIQDKDEIKKTLKNKIPKIIRDSKIILKKVLK